MFARTIARPTFSFFRFSSRLFVQQQAQEKNIHKCPKCRVLSQSQWICGTCDYINPSPPSYFDLFNLYFFHFGTLLE